MNREILLIAEAMKDAYEGEPWYGKPASVLLAEVDERMVFENPYSQHSIVELLWHMINWKEFVISRIRNIPVKRVSDFEVNDWRIINSSEKNMWSKGIRKFHEVHNELTILVQEQRDELLLQTVPDRKYTFKKLLHGIVQHDIYHFGQIAYIQKLLRKKSEEVDERTGG
jgi:uncharacterized damage-inducible protein DinB